MVKTGQGEALGARHFHSENTVIGLILKYFLVKNDFVCLICGLTPLSTIFIPPARVYSFRFSVRPFVCSSVSSFVIPERSWNLCQSFC